ncbi:MAG: SBBP repeat-containing protein [Acidobacteriota bacterium]
MKVYDTDWTIQKYDSSGKLAWNKTYNGSSPGYDSLNQVCLDSSGNIYAAGKMYSSVTNSDIAAMKLSSAGQVSWKRVYDGGAKQYDSVNAAAIDDKANFVITGQSAYSSRQPSCLTTLKYSSSGDLLWVRPYPQNDAQSWGRAVVFDKQGNTYVSGVAANKSGGGAVHTLKYAKNGAQKWARMYPSAPGSGWNSPSSIALDSSGNLYVVGYGQKSSKDPGSILTIKYDSAGTQAWVKEYKGK